MTLQAVQRRGVVGLGGGRGGGGISSAAAFWGYFENSIIQGAGLSDSNNIGPQVTPGLLDASLLVDGDGNASLSSIAALEAYCDSGDGSELNPYLIENRRLNNSEGANVGIQFAGSDDVFIKIKNCDISGYVFANIRSLKTLGTITVEHCLFNHNAATGGTVSTSHILMEGGSSNIIVIGCYAPSGGRTFLRELGGYAGTNMTAYNNLIDDSVAPWTGAATGVSMAFELGSPNPAVVASIYNNEVNGSVNSTMTYGIWISSVRTNPITLISYNNEFRNCGTPTVGNAIAVDGAGTVLHDITVTNTLFGPSARDCIVVKTCGTFDFGSCEMEDSGTNTRCLIFDGANGYDLRGIDVHHSKFTSNGGSLIECVYFLQTIDDICRYNVTYCDEDNYEYVRPRVGSHIFKYNYGVSTGATAAVLDIYQDHPTDSGIVEVTGLFGSGYRGVEINSRATGDIIQDVYVDTTISTNSIIVLRNLTLAVDNVTIVSSALSMMLSGSGSIVENQGVNGANNTYNGIAV